MCHCVICLNIHLDDHSLDRIAMKTQASTTLISMGMGILNQTFQKKRILREVSVLSRTENKITKKILSEKNVNKIKKLQIKLY